MLYCYFYEVYNSYTHEAVVISQEHRTDATVTLCLVCMLLHARRCYERHILDVKFERYMEADVAVEE
eukprot:790-Heterococcus_DN1.PRE.2